MATKEEIRGHIRDMLDDIIKGDTDAAKEHLKPVSVAKSKSIISGEEIPDEEPSETPDGEGEEEGEGTELEADDGEGEGEEEGSETEEDDAK